MEENKKIYKVATYDKDGKRKDYRYYARTEEQVLDFFLYLSNTGNYKLVTVMRREEELNFLIYAEKGAF